MLNSIFLFLLLSGYFFLLGYGIYQYRLGEKPVDVEVVQVENLSTEERNYVHGWRLIKWSLIAMAIAFGSSMLLIGIPGAVWIGGLTWLGLFHGPAETAASWAWPLAILITMLLPLCIPLSVAVFQFGEVRGIECLARYGIHVTVFVWFVFMIFYPNVLVRALN